jgi:D-alanine--D-alanine ligase
MNENNTNNGNGKDKVTSPSIFAGRTILVVNTGTLKKKFILQKLNRLGLTIVILNKEINWAQPYADHWILADTGNHKESLLAVEKFIADHPEIKLEGALTFWEDDVLLTSKIIDKFKFIGIPLNVSAKIRNKFALRDFFKNNNLPSIGYKLIKSRADLENITDTLHFPLVLKPVYGSSSAFVLKAEDMNELLDNYDYILQSLSLEIESSLADGKELLVEEYIDGEEVDIDILVQNGRIKFLAVSDNTKTKEPFFIETDRFTPSNLPDKEQEDLIALVDETLERMGVANGCLHFEAKSTSKGPVTIEINLRMGGDETYFSLKEAWRVDLIEGAVKIALGMYMPKVKMLEEPYKYLIARTLNVDRSGILVKLDVDEEALKTKKFLEEFEIFKKVGEAVYVPPEGYEYLGWLMVSGDNFLDAQDNLNDVLDCLHFEVAKFSPASSLGKTSRRNHFSFSALNTAGNLKIDKIEKIRKMSIKNQRNLHIGVACNSYDETSGGSVVERDLTSIGLNIQKTLEERGYKVSFFDFNNLSKVFNDLAKSDVDMIFNVCERINNSSLLEPHAASIFDALQIPYTGSNPFTLGLCIDKIRVKKLLTYHQIPTPAWDYVYDLNEKVRDDLKYPLIVKPANTDNSIGITNDSVVTNKEELKKQLQYVIGELKRPALIEEYIEGDEYDVSIIGSEEDDLRVLPLSRSIFDKMPVGYWHIYPFEAKFNKTDVYKKGIVKEIPPRNISKTLESLLSEISLDTYNILDCHDYGRIEIRVDKNNNPYVLELNPNPSINIGDAVPVAGGLIGLDYADFLEEIIRLAIKRYQARPPYFHLQSSVR